MVRLCSQYLAVMRRFGRDYILCGSSRYRRENRANSLGSRRKMEALRRTGACSLLNAEVSTSRKEMARMLAK